MPVLGASACTRDAAPPGPPEEVVAVSARESRGTVGAALTEPLVVRVLDAGGRGVPDVPVRWSSESARASVTPPEAVTDRDGAARATWTLGPDAGAQRASAVVTTVGGPVTLEFVAQAAAGAPARVRLSAEARAFAVGDSAGVRIAVSDAFGNPLDATQASLSVGDPAVLAVGPPGVLRGLRPGATTAYVRTSAGSADSVRIRVYAPFRGTAVGVGLGFSCALGEDARAYCWGVRPGTVVPPEGAYRSVPEAVSTSLTFVSIAVGQSHACGLTPAGLAWCWGGNAQGQLGDGTFTSSPTPVPVTGAVRFTRIAAGGLTTCAVTPDARAWCWGSNANGRLDRHRRLPARRRRLRGP